MSKGDKNDRAAGGLMSSAGLTTYYDAEDESFAFDPRSILLFGIFAAIAFASINLLLV